jgi:hypothetical protein
LPSVCLYIYILYLRMGMEHTRPQALAPGLMSAPVWFPCPTPGSAHASLKLPLRPRGRGWGHHVLSCAPNSARGCALLGCDIWIPSPPTEPLLISWLSARTPARSWMNRWKTPPAQGCFCTIPSIYVVLVDLSRKVPESAALPMSMAHGPSARRLPRHPQATTRAVRQPIVLSAIRMRRHVRSLITSISPASASD